MSDYLVKIIPAEPENKITMEAAEAITKRIYESIKSDTVEFKSEGSPFFVDCGSNLDEIKCPICGEVLDFGWWGEAMEEAGENRFLDLSVVLPCCGAKSSLNELKYHFPCGFARTVITIHNPEEGISEELLMEIERIAGISVKVIHSHL